MLFNSFDLLFFSAHRVRVVLACVPTQLAVAEPVCRGSSYVFYGSGQLMNDILIL